MAVGRRIEGPDDPFQEGRTRLTPSVPAISGRSPTEPRPGRVENRSNPPDGPASCQWDRRSRDERSHGDRDGRGCTDQSDGIARRRPRVKGRADPTKRTQHDPVGKEDSDGRDRTGRVLCGGAARIRQSELSCPRGTPDPMKTTRRMHGPSTGRSHPRADRPPRHGRRPPYSTVLRHTNSCGLCGLCGLWSSHPAGSIAIFRGTQHDRGDRDHTD